MTGSEDHYRTLGVSQDASAARIREAYRECARRNHPDRVIDPALRSSAAERMAAANEAWRVLGDPKRRAAYDHARRLPMVSPLPEQDNRSHGRRGDSFEEVKVSPAAGCALRFFPVVLGLLVLLGIFVGTAFLGNRNPATPRMSVGRCVELSTTVRVVPCTVDTPTIVGRGLAGTSCPETAIALVLPSRTEQICVDLKEPRLAD